MALLMEFGDEAAMTAADAAVAADEIQAKRESIAEGMNEGAGQLWFTRRHGLTEQMKSNLMLARLQIDWLLTPQLEKSAHPSALPASTPAITPCPGGGGDAWNTPGRNDSTR